ncbi:MAG: starch-binding protein [Alistipes sp.]|nr:starch-binding protein [Alistipes sp.]
MKKLLYSILALAGVVATSCTQEHVEVQYIPGNVVAPTLGAIEGCDLSDDGADIVVDYTEADFGVATGKAHNLYVAKTEDMAEMKKATAKFENGKITVAQSVINVIAMDFAEPGSSVDMYFAVVATLSTDKGATVAGTESMSNVVKATFKSFNAEVLPSEKFDKVWVIGNYCGWDHGKTQFLFDYNSTGTTFSGVVDFSGADGVSMAADGFKLTGVAGWDDTCNWGLEDNTTAAAEAASLQLITGGGSQDIKCYAKRFYGFEYDKSTLVLKKSWGADQIGIIGLNGDWTNDVVMEYNPVWTRFYADIEVEANGTLKFRADAAWDLNWGAAHFGLEGDNDGNIFVEAGNYRVYFNPVSGLLEFSASKYDTEEDLTGNGGGTTPEPEPTETTYGLIGSFNGWSESDVDLVARGDGWYVVKEVVIPAAEENKFLIRLNDGWSNKFGFAEDNTFVTIDAKNTLTAEGKDMWITDGTFDFYFNPTTAELYVMTTGAADPTLSEDAKAVKFYADVTATGWTNCNIYGWGDLGEYGGGWPGTALSTETIDGKEYYAYTFDVSAWGKTVNVIFNNGSEQTANIENIVLDKDYIFTLTEKGGDGKWAATVNGEAPVTPEPPAVKEYGLVGSLTSWGSSPDIKFTDAGNGCYTLMGQPLTTEDAFKVRLYGVWDDTENYGLATAGTVNINEAITLITSGVSGDMKVAVSGTYDLYFYPAAFTLYVMTEGTAPEIETPAVQYGLVGEFNGWGSSSDLLFEDYQGGYLCVTNVVLEAGKGFKVRFYNDGSWNSEGDYALERGASTVIGEAMTLKHGGDSDNLSVSTTGTYDIYFNPTACIMYVMVAGEVPAI